MSAKVDPVEVARRWLDLSLSDDMNAIAHVVLAAAKIEGHWYGCETWWGPLGDRHCTCGYDALVAALEGR